MQNVHMMHMSPFRGAIFMMQMSHAIVQMQHLSMMMPAHIFNRDARVSLQRWRCKCLLGAWRDVDVHLWVCHDANVHVGMS